MGKQKKNCWKCGDRHAPPTGNKCDKLELSNVASVSNAEMVVNRSETEKESFVIPDAAQLPATSSTQGVHGDLQTKILEQLQRVNQHLDRAEGRMAEEQNGVKQQDSKRKKLSNFSKRHCL